MKTRALLLILVGFWLPNLVSAGLLSKVDMVTERQLQLVCQPRQYQNWQACARVCREQVPDCQEAKGFEECRLEARGCEKLCKGRSGC